MFRALLKNSFYFARRIKKTTSIQPIEQGEDTTPPSAPRGVRSEFKHMKDLFSQMDKQGESKDEQNPDLDRTLEFFQKMIVDDKKSQTKEAKAKSKVTVEQKLRKLGTPENIIRKRQFNNLPEQPTPNFTMQELRNDSLVSQIIEQSGSTAEELANRTNRDLKLAQQELILQQIMKKSKQKEVKLDVEQTKNPESEQQYQKRLILRREKIIESLQQKQDPTEARIDWTTEDLLALKYSPEILAKAREYTNKQLMYFKELINDEESDNNKSRLNKRHYRDHRDEEKHMQELSKYDGVTEPFIENSYLSIKQEEGLKIYEDDQFYKDKAAVQLREKERLTPEDLQLRASLQQDLELGQKISDVFLDESVFPQEAKVDRRLAYSETSFAKQDQQIRNLTQRLDKLGVDFSGEEVKALSKQLLFEEKHFLEVQQGFQKYLQRKEKKKNMKKELRQAHKTVLRDDVDFQKEQEAVMSVKQVRQSSDSALLEDNFEKLREFQARKQAVLVQTTPEEKQSEVHRKKTFKNMENFLALYFANGLLNHNVGQLNEIEILQVVPNKCNTVMNIFWNISSDYLLKAGIVPGSNNYDEKFQKEKVKLEDRLKNQANYISGKMTQLLRLRYGPQVRFHFDAKTKKTLEAIQELSKFTKEIAMVQLQEYTSKGLIKNEQEELEYYEKLLNVSKGKLDQFNSRKQLLSKNYQKFHKNQQLPMASIKQEKRENLKNKRKNPVLQENFKISQERKPNTHVARKKKPSDKLWESIDLL